MSITNKMNALFKAIKETRYGYIAPLAFPGTYLTYKLPSPFDVFCGLILWVAAGYVWTQIKPRYERYLISGHVKLHDFDRS